MGLSNVGIFHTLIGIVAIVAAIISYGKYGKIKLEHPADPLIGKTLLILLYCSLLDLFFNSESKGK